MKSKLRILCIVSGLLFAWGSVTQVYCENLEWSAKAELNLEASPLDVATSADGEWLFVLIPGQLLVYSAPENRLLKQIPLEGEFDRLAHSHIREFTVGKICVSKIRYNGIKPPLF